MTDALKFSNENGVVELSVQLRSSNNNREDDNDDDDDDQVLRFVIKDYGKGIEEKDYEKIFQPFMQTNNSDMETERLYGGTGLGLS